MKILFALLMFSISNISIASEVEKFSETFTERGEPGMGQLEVCARAIKLGKRIWRDELLSTGNYNRERTSTSQGPCTCETEGSGDRAILVCTIELRVRMVFGT